MITILTLNDLKEILNKIGISCQNIELMQISEDGEIGIKIDVNADILYPPKTISIQQQGSRPRGRPPKAVTPPILDENLPPEEKAKMEEIKNKFFSSMDTLPKILEMEKGGKK